MERVPLTSENLVGAGFFPYVNSTMEDDLQAADRTIRDLQAQLSERLATNTWSSHGVGLDLSPVGDIWHEIAAYVESDEVSFQLDIRRRVADEWAISAEVWVESVAPEEPALSLAAEVTTETVDNPEAATAAYSAAARDLARAALERDPIPEAWRHA